MRGERIIEVLIGAVAAVIACLAVAGSTEWSAAAVIGAGVAFGVLFWAIVWAITQGRRSALAGRVGVGVVVGVLLGELAAVVVFGGQIDDELAGRASPGTAVAAAALEQARQSRAGLDDAVAQANRQRDEALVVARCEFNPSPDCPQIRITGLPGTGPEARTADEFLDDAQRRLDTAVAERDGRAAALDAAIGQREQALAQSRDDALAGGLGTRWQAMNSYTLDHPGALVLRILVVAFFVFVTMLPLLVRRWRGATTAEAESAADTAIAVKRAEVRAQVDQLWAEQELTKARLAVAAQNEIDAEQQRRRVAEALDALPGQQAIEVVQSERMDRPALPAPGMSPSSSKELEPHRDTAPHRGGGVPIIPDVTRAAVRLIRPFVPPVVAGAVDNVTKPLRQVFQETEEFHFTLRRTHRVTVESEGGEAPQQLTTEREWVDVSGPHIESHRGAAIHSADDHPELRGGDGPRRLPPA